MRTAQKTDNFTVLIITYNSKICKEWYFFQFSDVTSIKNICEASLCNYINNMISDKKKYEVAC